MVIAFVQMATTEYGELEIGVACPLDCAEFHPLQLEGDGSALFVKCGDRKVTEADFRSLEVADLIIR